MRRSDNDQVAPAGKAAKAYRRIVSPPPGPRWENVSGRGNLVIALVSLYVIENTGIRLLAAILRANGFTVHELYFKDWVTNRIAPPSERELRLLIDELRRIGAGLVGMSVRASAFHALAADITERIRRELDVPVIWGGMHATSCPEDAASVADMICIGEAEDTILELARRLRSGKDVRDIRGLWVYTSSGLVRNGPPPLAADLDRFPFPDFHSADKAFIEGGRLARGDPCAGQPIYLIMGSRACPLPSCTFCSNSVMRKIYGDEWRYRVRSVSHILAEVAYIRKHFPNLKRIRFDDEEFPVACQWFDEFCERWPREAGLPFEIHIDPRATNSERLRRLKAAGLDMVFMGIQSTEKINRELYRRDVSDLQVLDAARAIHGSGIHVGYQVILDDPVSTSADKKMLFDLLLQLPRPYEMVLFSLTVYPGSTLADELRRRGLIGGDDIEGPSTKAFRQFRVDLSYPRAAEERFWTSLVVLVSKDFIPKSLLKRLASSSFLARHTAPLTGLAFTANVLKLGIMGVQMLIRGEMSWAVIRRWLNLKSLVTY